MFVFVNSNLFSGNTYWKYHWAPSRTSRIRYLGRTTDKHSGERDFKPPRLFTKIVYYRFINCSGVNDFSCFRLSPRVLKFTIHGKRSETLLMSIDEEILVWFWGRNYFYISYGKNSLNFSCSSICTIFILKSPTTVMYLFSFYNMSIRDEDSAMNFEMFPS